MKKHDPIDIRSQEKAHAETELRRKLSKDTEDADFKWLMSSKRGRRIVWRLLDHAGIFRSSFNTNSMAMAFAEGNKNEGLRILALVHANCPELYPVMVREANEQRDIDDGNSHNDH